MISFLELNADNAEPLIAGLSEGKAELFDDISEIVLSFLEEISEEVGFAFCRLDDMLLVRIFDGGEYIFVYPIALSDTADEASALEAIRLYAVKEEIPLVFCDVPEESLSAIDEAFRFSEAYAEDDEGESFRVRVLTEISRAVDIPEVGDGTLTLRPLTEEDIPDYARLCRDAELNKYWGYDYRADAREPSDEYFYDVAMRALDDGVALSLAVDLEGKFVGEATLWGFDLKGGCKLGFRILPEWQRRGFGKRTLARLLELCSELGIRVALASVMKENAPSIAVVEKVMAFCRQEDGINYYLKEFA